MSDLRRYDYVIQRMLPTLVLYGWECRVSQDDPKPGDLVMMTAAPMSEWHLSIFRERGEGNEFTRENILESLKTGRLGRWHNVGFHVMNMEKLGLGDQWKWTDEQFDFQDKFRKVCKRGDYHMALPFIDEFVGNMVYIKFRTRFSFNDKITSVPAFDYTKITQKSLLAMLDKYEAEHKD